jgi:ferredoxin
VDEALCMACELCIEKCQFNALTVEDVAVVQQIRCVGCGVCAGLPRGRLGAGAPARGADRPRQSALTTGENVRQARLRLNWEKCSKRLKVQRKAQKDTKRLCVLASLR